MSETDEQFTAYVVARRDQLRRTAYLLCGNHATAEDLVQTTLTKLYLAWPRVSRMAGPDAYARRVLVTSHIDLVRRPWWSRERSAGDDLPEPEAADGFTFEDRDELLAALGQLAPSMRRVLVLRHLWGASIAETADVLGVSAGTVKSQTAKAIARLEQLLAATPTEHEGITR
ncbi:SigE family RNA polymerase sigma factor [Intrasporangium sp.]|uniref:SigE family RNA polymerase sigma factor n=1 Tax=Intrasporangium sp. TaxID=1925024 RepID=UPI00293A9CA0|nr:SigE family RNA polymerase sigma factor [Intrasporangium sp.]MDV3222968.1 SigE family RNA polymerase sigma factor [Intrasporangium sp.]